MVDNLERRAQLNISPSCFLIRGESGHNLEAYINYMISNFATENTFNIEWANWNEAPVMSMGDACKLCLRDIKNTKIAVSSPRKSC